MTVSNGLSPRDFALAPPQWVVVVLAALVNFFAAHLTLLVPTVGGPAYVTTVMWPPMGINFALTWYYGRGALVGAALGTVFFLFHIDGDLLFSVLTAITTVLPPAYASWRLHKNGVADPFATPRNVLQFVFFAVLIAPLFSACSGPLVSLLSGSKVRWNSVAWFFLWSNSAIAISIIAPVCLKMADWRTLSKRKLTEFGVTVAAVFIVWGGAFLTNLQAMMLPMAMLTAPFLILMAFRFSFGIVANLTLLISLLALVSLKQNPFGDNQNAFFITSAYLGMLGLSNLAVSAGSAALRATVEKLTRSEEKWRDSEQRFRITFEQAAVGVALLDRDSNWLQVNKKFCDIVGYDHDELLKLPYSKLISPEDMEYTMQSVAGVRNNNTSQVQLDHRYMRKNGDIIWVNSQFSVARTAAGEIDYQIAIIKDITERKLAETEIERLALYDYLTELPNRRLFGDRLRTAVMAAKRSARFGALIYIDLDNFKQLNDTHGHNAGDDFLKMVAHRLQRNLREEDTVARIGGDEFVVLLQNVSDSIATATAATTAIAEKIQSALCEPFLLPNGIEHIVTSSLGITLFPKDAENADDLLREADIAMYRVKESQRNAMRFYEPAMKAEVDSRLALERALRRALQDNEFELYLQPQYDGKRKMVSCEALLRWPQPGGGFISPNEFIPLAEETGLIVPLGEWVLRRAGQLVSSLQMAGHTLSICVNVSPRQFSEANFVERVRTILWEVGADAGHIVLEITEGVVVADFDDVRTKMQALREMGITLSVDDFGTGHSSLAYLKLLPLHELKIDRAFVQSLPDDANDVAIVEAVLSVARHLQLEVVAEGVETTAQLDFLKVRGCHRFQGYLLARPALPQQHFPELSK